MSMATTTRLSRGIDAAIAFPLLAVHLALGWGASVLVTFAVTTMQDCQSAVCPDTSWTWLVLLAAAVGVIALPVIDLALTITALCMRRPAWLVPLAMSAVHVAYTVLLLVLLAQAGRA
ncbi:MULTISPECIES: hypothetical protein [Mycobacteriaceae]|jgi:hypothetical protein|nr:MULTISPECIES: hypothetical protein [Mycobacteriaceae]MBE5438355.1 hypothetical protein [Mycobacteroides abscessus]MBV6363330.1 hypothetical protein [Mycobacteroides chelonae]MCV7275516.1 hypothetical protein [Mycolicibacter arupensis]MDM1903571.1 hypothetical protein [Mycobacteroides abscessus]MDM2366374.1 hypothetical protein [Mycobacteroides abscessus]